jgi:hypothetical protein
MSLRASIDDLILFYPVPGTVDVSSSLYGKLLGRVTEELPFVGGLVFRKPLP